MSGFVAALRLFFVYGLNGRPQLTSPAVGQNEFGISLNLTSEDPKRKDHAPYRPPHLRKKDGLNSKQPKAQDSRNLSDHESSAVDFMSSDSDYSDSDGLPKDFDGVRSSRVRVAAIVCLQVSPQYQHFICFDLFPEDLMVQGFVLISLTSSW